MEKPHIYSSFEIADAVHAGWGVDDHLRNTQFVKLSEYDAMMAQKTGDQKLNFDMFFDEREENGYLRQQADQLRRENEALVAQLKKAIQDQECWIPCALRLPEYRESVIVKGTQGTEVRFLDTVDDNDEYSGAPIHYDCWFKEYEVDNDPYYFIEFDEVKCWMPLPKDPVEPKKEEEQNG